MPPPTAIQITAPTSGAPLTPAQKRFNTLIRQIEQARQTLAAWHENIGHYRVAHAGVMQPLQAELLATLRQWAFALGEAAGRPGWSKAERATLRELTCEAARELLDTNGDDAEVKALFDQHSDIDFDSEQRESAQLMKAMAEEFSGLDLGDDAEALTEEELFDRMGEGLRQRVAQEQEARAARAATGRKKPAQQRREAEEQQAAQSLREIFRKLASALHPDRETDAVEREAKTAMMQRVNQAYAANDLLTLLELQLQIEQIDASHIASASAARLKHYNTIMAEQLGELRDEITRMEMGWKAEFGISPFAQADPRRLMQVLQTSQMQWRSDLADMQRDIRRVSNGAATKQWLKAERKRLRDGDFDSPFF